MFFGTTGYIILAAVVALAIVGGGFKLYFDYSQKQIATLQTNNATLEAGLESQKKATKKLDSVMKKQNKLSIKLEKRIAEAQSESDRLSRILEKHDFELLSFRRPGLIENRVNKATRKILMEMENESKF